MLTEEEHIQKAMKYNFPQSTYSGVDVRERQVDGKTCEQRVRERRASGESQGKIWYDSLRVMYKPTSAPEKNITIVDVTQPMMPSLETALKPLMAEKDIGHLSEFFENNIAFTNQKSFAVCAKAMLQQVPSLGKPHHRQLWMTFFGFISAHDHHTTWADTFRPMEKRCDLLLGDSATKYKNSTLPITMWWAGYKHVGRLLFPEASMAKVCAVKPGPNASYDPVEAELREVYASCNTARDLFSGPMRRLQRGKTGVCINAALDAMLGANITSAAVILCKGAFATSMIAIGIDPAVVGQAYNFQTSRYI